jgi:hypothetical protein
MLWLAVILFIAWLLGFVVFHVAGGLIHLLLVIAVVVFIFNLLSCRRTVLPPPRSRARDGVSVAPRMGPNMQLPYDERPGA